MICRASLISASGCGNRSGAEASLFFRRRFDGLICAEGIERWQVIRIFACMNAKAVRMLILACAMWGLSFPAIKALALSQAASLPDAGTWFLSTATMVVRFSVAGVLALVITLIARGGVRMVGREIAQGIGLGVFGGLGMLVQVDGLAHTEASTSAFLTQGTVFFIPLVKMLWHRRLPLPREAVCCLIALAGIAILSGFDWRSFQMGRGEAETLVAALLFTAHILCLEVPAFRGNDALKVSVVMFATIAVMCLPLLWIVGDGWSAAAQSFAQPSSWFFLAILIGPCTLLAFMWMNCWQPHVSATTAGLIYCLEPVFTSVFALFLPGWLSAMSALSYADEKVTTTLLTGGGLILLANVLMQWPGTKTDVGPLNEHGV